MASLVKSNALVISAQHAITRAQVYTDLLSILGRVLASCFPDTPVDAISRRRRVYWRVDEATRNRFEAAAEKRVRENQALGVEARLVNRPNDRRNTDFLAKYGLRTRFVKLQSLHEAYDAAMQNGGRDANADDRIGFVMANGVELPYEEMQADRDERILEPLAGAIRVIADELKMPEESVVSWKLTDIADYRHARESQNPSHAVFYHIGLIYCIRGSAGLEDYAACMGRCLIGENVYDVLLREMVVNTTLYSFCRAQWADIPALDPESPWDDWMEAFCTKQNGRGLDVVHDFWISLARVMRVWDWEIERITGSSKWGIKNVRLCKKYFNERSGALEAADAQIAKAKIAKAQKGGSADE